MGTQTGQGEEAGVKAFKIKYEEVSTSVFFVAAETADAALAKMREHFDADDGTAQRIYFNPDAVEGELTIESNDEFDVPEDRCVA